MRFADHYGLDGNQREQAQARLQWQKERTLAWFATRPGSADWLLAGLWSDFERKAFKRTFSGGTADVNITVTEQVAEYRNKVNEYRSLLHDRPEALGKDVEKIHRAAVRSEVAGLRTELLTMVDGQTAQMKDTLAGVLTDEQKAKGAVPVPEESLTFIKCVDFMTRWGLLLIGAGLLLGLFSRTSAFCGAMFLLLTVLTTPALPWLPAPPNAEGSYVFINKNVIEMIALFMLACIPSGRWFGLDALIHAVNPWRKKTNDNA
jgi:uncharacterized membrane protein YphA (DoxX/SURF4 family)